MPLTTAGLSYTIVHVKVTTHLARVSAGKRHILFNPRVDPSHNNLVAMNSTVFEGTLRLFIFLELNYSRAEEDLRSTRLFLYIFELCALQPVVMPIYQRALLPLQPVTSALSKRVLPHRTNLLNVGRQPSRRLGSDACQYVCRLPHRPSFWLERKETIGVERQHGRNKISVSIDCLEQVSTKNLCPFPRDFPLHLRLLCC